MPVPHARRTELRAVRARYPMAMELRNGRVADSSQGSVSSADNVVPKREASTHSEKPKIRIHHYGRDSSYSDMPRPYTGVDIRDNEGEDFLMTHNGGQLRAAYSQIEGLDAYAAKESPDSSSKNNGEGTASYNKVSTIDDENSLRPPKLRHGLTPFERVKADFEKRSGHKSEIRRGKRLGFYRLILDIGRGNFSKVKLATHLILDAEVAVKIIDRTKFDAKTRRLLSQELDNMEHLNHPNIIRVFEVHESPQRWHLIMEYAPAGELHSYLKRNGRMEDKAAKNLSTQIISALEHMHKHGVVHRDLKAENVMFSSSTWVKVGDFGFSKFVNPTDALTTFCGSPPYAAPELFVADSYIGPAVDLWALGVLIFYMVTGGLPFRGDCVSRIKRAVLDGSYVIPDYVAPGCQDLINGLLTRPVEQRLNMDGVKNSSWFSGFEWIEKTRDTHPLPNQVDDATVRGWLRSWWQIDDWELNKALKEGPRNSLTGIYRILRAEGKKYERGKAPNSVKKSNSRHSEHERRHHHHHRRSLKTEEGPVKSSRVVTRRAVEVTTIDLRDKRTTKGKIDKGGATKSKTCTIV
ncbi:unnamed protein product [Calicophoron daubneyi]|uniref:non-specific serine/threonine protein kinase n=1 Tax=Calicophoron daubneyi TaxID=300641 RepID=A0AAV2TSL8_CALDB